MRVPCDCCGAREASFSLIFAETSFMLCGPCRNFVRLNFVLGDAEEKKRDKENQAGFVKHEKAT